VWNNIKKKIMSKKDYISIAVCLAGIAFGFWYGHFMGGLVAGFSICLLTFTTIGQILFAKAARRIDKRTEDIRNGGDD